MDGALTAGQKAVFREDGDGVYGQDDNWGNSIFTLVHGSFSFINYVCLVGSSIYDNGAKTYRIGASPDRRETWCPFSGGRWVIFAWIQSCFEYGDCSHVEY